MPFHCIYDSLYLSKKRFRNTVPIPLIFKVHADINQDEVAETYNPKLDGFYGFRASAHLLEGQSFLRKTEATFYSYGSDILFLIGRHLFRPGQHNLLDQLYTQLILSKSL